MELQLGGTKMEYTLSLPPFQMKDFLDMNEEEAKQFFDWYVSEIPNRMHMLYEVANHQVSLDYTRGSLMPLFQWYLDQIELHELSESDIALILDSIRDVSETIFDEEKELLLENPYEVSADNIDLAMDIAIYYAQTIIHHFPEVRWTYFTSPRNHSDLNEPVLYYKFGEIEYLRNPRQLLLVLLEDIKDQSIEETTLMEIFDIDSKVIENI